MDHIHSDPFRNRGAIEQDSPEQQSNLDFAGQLGHRNKGPLIDSQDSDFPEPGETPEHSGEVMMQRENEKQTEHEQPIQADDETEVVDQDPGERQKRNQNEQEDDPLAA